MYRPKYECFCPFYAGEFRKSICCDGIEECTRTIREFESEEQKNKYISEHCIKECPEDCDLFHILIDKYGAD